jgi:hypothetical protein
MPSWYLTLERRTPGVPSTNVDWYSLSKFEPQLRSMAESQGLKPLLEFFSCGPEDLPEQVDAEVTEQWFSPGDALKTVTGLLTYLRKTDNQLLQNKRLLQELDEFERVLTDLNSRGIRFHIAIDY